MSRAALNRAAACAWTGLEIRNPDAVEVWSNTEVIFFRVTLTSDVTDLDDVLKEHGLKNYNLTTLPIMLTLTP